MDISLVTRLEKNVHQNLSITMGVAGFEDELELYFGFRRADAEGH